MTYAQIDDRFDQHPKYVGLDWDLEHYGLQGCAITYCNRNLTDGFLPRSAVEGFGRRRKKRNLALASEFVKAGVWRENAGIFEIVGFLDHNPSKEEILKRRDYLHEVRAAAGRAGGRASGEARRKQTRSNPEPNGKQPANEREALSDPILSDPLRSSIPPTPPDDPRPPTVRDLGLAYVRGIERGAGICVTPPAPAEATKLLGALSVHGKGIADADQAAWVTDRAAEFCVAAAGDDYLRRQGFPIFGFIRWLNGRNASQVRPGVQGGRQTYGRNRLAGIED